MKIFFDLSFMSFMSFMAIIAFHNVNATKLTMPSLEEQKEIEQKGYSLKTFPHPQYASAPWPVMRIIQRINSSPLTAISVFGALDLQKSYVPNTIVSKPIKEISPTEIWTEYEISIPFPFPNAKHVHGSILSKPDSQSYELRWYWVSSNSTKNAEGFAQFLPDKDSTLFIYESFVWPDSKLAKFLSQIMEKDVLKSVQEIKIYTEKIQKINPTLLSELEQRTLNMLSGKSVYGDLILKTSAIKK